VIVLWDGRGIATDGQPYENTYAFFMQMRDGKVIDVTALFRQHFVQRPLGTSPARRVSGFATAANGDRACSAPTSPSTSTQPPVGPHDRI
jgi:hypothetical protein